MKEKTTIYLHPRARRYKSFLHHITKGSPVAKNILKQKEEKRQRPPTITKTEVQELLDACSNQRDRLLLWLLYESAMRVGDVLALEEKRKRVDEAITRLLRDQRAINFNAVAKAAGVSKTYLYYEPQLRDRIEALRQQEREQTIREQVARPTGKTDAAKDLVILAKERRIRELEEKNH